MERKAGIAIDETPERWALMKNSFKTISLGDAFIFLIFQSGNRTQIELMHIIFADLVDETDLHWFI